MIDNWTYPNPMLDDYDLGPYGLALWKHMAMWCPETLAKTLDHRGTFAALDRQVTAQIDEIAARLTKSNGGDYLTAGEQAEELVMSEWRIPKETDEAVWDGISETPDPWNDYRPEDLAICADQEWVSQYVKTLPLPAQHEFAAIAAQINAAVTAKMIERFGPAGTDLHPES